MVGPTRIRSSKDPFDSVTVDTCGSRYTFRATPKKNQFLLLFLSAETGSVQILFCSIGESYLVVPAWSVREQAS